MTRINVGVDPKKLIRQHLIAEHREIKRIPNAVRTGRAVIKDIPDTFRLGPGHVKFFYNKLGYLLTRYRDIYAECRHRGYQVQNYESAWAGVPADLMRDWTPSVDDRKLIEQRIRERS